MQWSSAVSKNPSLAGAVADCGEDIRSAMGGQSPDLVIAFVSDQHAPAYESVPELIGRELGDSLLIGCSANGIIGAGREVEHRPGFALCAARLPEVQIEPFHIEIDAMPDADAGPDRWEALVGVSASRDPMFLLLADPFSSNSESLLMGLDFAFPRSPKIGGIASGGRQPDANALYLGSAVHRNGVVGLAMHGDITVDTIVAQGCRPIGEPRAVTSCHRNVMLELGGQSPLEVLGEILAGLCDRDRKLAQHSLFLGVVMDELNDAPQLGDFLIRNIIGIDQNRGALAVSESLKEGQMVQFHLRDAVTSAQDLEGLLTRYAANHPIYADSGALLFSCLGRGSYLYGRADHDTDMFREKVGKIPLTGFFCNGEIGPVGGTTFLHGYTSSFGIIRHKRAE